MKFNFVEEWKSYKISEITEIVNGQVDPKNEPYASMPHIGPANISKFSGKILFYNSARDDKQTSGKYLFNELHVLYGKINPQLAKVAYPKFKGVCSADIYPIKPKEELLISEYLYYILLSDYFYNYSVPLSGRTGIPKINRKEFEAYRTTIPPILEQKKIAKVLSTIDNHIDEVVGMIDDLKELKKGLMQKLLNEGIEHTEFKITSFGKIPVEWEVKKLENIADIKRGASPRPIKDPKWFNEKSQIGWIRISDVSKSKKYLFETEQYLSKEGIDKSRLVNRDELIMSICASVGKPILMKMDACIHDGFVHFDKISSLISKEFVYYFLQTKENYYKGQGQTGTQANLNTTIVGLTDIPVPPLEEQKKIVEILSEVDSRIEIYETKKEDLQELKKGLMQQLLTGKTRVKED